MPTFALTDADGAFRIAHLAGGPYDYKLFTRFLGGEPISFLPDRFQEPDELASGDFTIEDGKETSLEIDATPLDQLQPCTVRGVVRREGRPAADLSISVGGRSNGRATTDEMGRFEVVDVKPGDVYLRITGKGDGASGVLYTSQFKLQSAEVRDLSIDLRYVEVTLFVHDDKGGPIAGAFVNATRTVAANSTAVPEETLNAWGNTGDDGKALLALSSPGAWEFTVQSDASGRGSAKADVPASGLDHPIDVALDPGVRCSGRIEFDGISPSADQPWWIAIEPVEPSNHDDGGAQARVNGKEKTFEAAGLRAGTWRASFYSPGSQPMMSQAFTLTSQGDTNLVLRFKEP
jgi:hypothetical protein